MTVEALAYSVTAPRLLAHFAGGVLLAVLFNIGDLTVLHYVTKSWLPIFAIGTTILALLWLLAPLLRRPFALTAALFVGIVLGMLGGGLLMLDMYGV